MRFDLVIFDLDGTLVHSLPDIAAALNTALGEQGRPALPEDQVQTLVGEGVVKLAEKALAVIAAGRLAPSASRLAPAGGELAPAQSDDVQRLADRVRDIYRQHPCVASRPFPEIVETLVTLRSTTGRHLAVLTNKPGEVTRPLLDAVQLTGYFDAIIGDGDGHPRKPDPAAARSLIARFGTTAERTLIVGDGLPDVAVGRAVPCAVAAALWGYTPEQVLRGERAEFELRAPGELLAIV
jgi:phosphoglycolate phosphatase